MPDLTSHPTPIDEARDTRRPEAAPRKGRPRRARKVIRPEEIETPPKPKTAEPVQSPPAWGEFIRTATAGQIEQRFVEEAEAIVASQPEVAGRYACVAILEPEESIDQF